MIVKLPSSGVDQTEAFQKDFASFPLEAREKLLSLVKRFLDGERLSPTAFKIFQIDGRNKILEFKIKDRSGNWRAIAVYMRARLVLIYAFHKKSQQLLELDKNAIRNRIRRLE